MARVRIMLAAVLAIAALAVLAGPASASVSSASTGKFCKAAAKIGNDASNATGFTKAEARKLSAQFKAAAKYAPAKVKKAVSNITKLLGVIAGTTDPTDLARVYTSDSFKRYPGAVTTFFTYQATACS